MESNEKDKAPEGNPAWQSTGKAAFGFVRDAEPKGHGPKKYKKKAVIIEALRLQWSTWSEMCDFLGTTSFGEGAAGVYISKTGEVTEDPAAGIIGLKIPTLEGTMLAKQGDWIIKGVKGEFYPCRDDIFQMTYALVEEGTKEDLVTAKEDIVTATENIVTVEVRVRGKTHKWSAPFGQVRISEHRKLFKRVKSDDPLGYWLASKGLQLTVIMDVPDSEFVNSEALYDSEEPCSWGDL